MVIQAYDYLYIYTYIYNNIINETKSQNLNIYVNLNVMHALNVQ